MFSSRLKELRTNAKLSQKALASQLFVSQQAVARWETDKATPNPEMLSKIATILNVSVDDLLGSPKKSPLPTSSDEQKIDEMQIMAAFWGGDQDLTEEDKRAMWADVKNFAAFVAQQKKQEKQRND